MAGISMIAVANAPASKITLADLDGGVFTITNGGTFGSLLDPHHQPATKRHPRPRDQRASGVVSQVVIRPMMYLALSYDHRSST